jgi:hypothetical protein
VFLLLYKNTLVHYNASVAVVNASVVGLAPGTHPMYVGTVFSAKKFGLRGHFFKKYTYVPELVKPDLS